jgi:cytochrome c-type biogenesis protein CcmH/NrfF
MWSQLEDRTYLLWLLPLLLLLLLSTQGWATAALLVARKARLGRITPEEQIKQSDGVLGPCLEQWPNDCQPNDCQFWRNVC